MPKLPKQIPNFKGVFRHALFDRIRMHNIIRERKYRLATVIVSIIVWCLCFPDNIEYNYSQQMVIIRVPIRTKG